MSVAALILAGGRGSRLGAAVPKPLVRLGDSTLLGHVLRAVPAEAQPVFLNARPGEGFEAFGLALVPDARPGFAGPLAGIEAAGRSRLLAAAGATHLLVLPGDTPFLPREALSRLIASPGARPRVASHGGRLQPTVTVWPVACLDAISDFLDTEAKHSIRACLDRMGFTTLEIDGDDPFMNVNTPADLEAAEKRIACG